MWLLNGLGVNVDTERLIIAACPVVLALIMLIFDLTDDPELVLPNSDANYIVREFEVADCVGTVEREKRKRRKRCERHERVNVIRIASTREIVFRRIKKIFLAILVVAIIVGLGITAYANSLFEKMQQYSYSGNIGVSISDIAADVSDSDIISTGDSVLDSALYDSVIDEDVINILLIGTDVRSDDYDDMGNTDSMILVSIDTESKSIKLTSFMRDLYVTIPGYGKNRLNAAYSYGGPELLFRTLNYNFGVSVDEYVIVDFSAFADIIDEIGGVEIELTAAEAKYMNKYSYKYNTDTVEAGLQTLDGNQALSYARCRKVDSDFGRVERQQKVVKAAAEKLKACSIFEINSLLNDILPTVYTNVTRLELLKLAIICSDYTEIETLSVPITGSCVDATINGAAVLVADFDANAAAISEFIYGIENNI